VKRRARKVQTRVSDIPEVLDAEAFDDPTPGAPTMAEHPNRRFMLENRKDILSPAARTEQIENLKKALADRPKLPPHRWREMQPAEAALFVRQVVHPVTGERIRITGKTEAELRARLRALEVPDNG
jgi:hypothetical protein